MRKLIIIKQGDSHAEIETITFLDSLEGYTAKLYIVDSAGAEVDTKTGTINGLIITYEIFNEDSKSYPIGIYDFETKLFDDDDHVYTPTSGKFVVEAVIEEDPSIDLNSYWATRYISDLTLMIDSDIQVTLNWINNGIADYTGHKVYISIDNGETFILSKTIANIGTFTIITGLTEGTYYNFYIVAYKGISESEVSNIVSGWTELVLENDGHSNFNLDSRNLDSLTKAFNGSTGYEEVSEWKDSLGSGHDLLQENQVARPLWSFANGLLHDGLNKIMDMIDFTWNQPCTIYILLRQITWTTNRFIFEGKTQVEIFLRQAAAGVSPTSPEIEVNAGSNSDHEGNLALNTFGIATIVFNGANSLLQVNDNIALIGNFGTNNPGGFRLAGSHHELQLRSNIEVLRIVGRDEIGRAHV